MYGSLESAIQIFKEYSNHLKELGYQQSRMDPFVFFIKDEKERPMLLTFIHVNDTLIVGTKG